MKPRILFAQQDPSAALKMTYIEHADSKRYLRVNTSKAKVIRRLRLGLSLAIPTIKLVIPTINQLPLPKKLVVVLVLTIGVRMNQIFFVIT